jgi:CRP/FNR family transcriptional regulator, anaerobic regulatory protein
MNIGSSSWRYPCVQCPLVALRAFRNFGKEELDFVSGFKIGELTVDPGTTLLAEGSQSAHVYTALSGWGFRYKLLEDGRRQVLNFVLPGDFVGLQASLLTEMHHSVEALTGMLLCVFERGRLWELYRNQPSLAFDLTWMAAREERMLDSHLLSIGQRTGEERAAYLLVFLFGRARSRNLTRGEKVIFPFSQPLLADALGLSLVHTNRILNRFARRGLIGLEKRQIALRNLAGLRKIADWHEDSEPPPRPFI